MVLSGLVVLAFVIYHLLHFTLGAFDPSYAKLIDAQGRHDVYRMVILGFSNPAVSISYLVAMVLLGMHLHHGASSVFQTLGLTGKKHRKWISCVGPLLAAVVIVGNSSIPLSVMAGWLK